MIRPLTVRPELSALLVSAPLFLAATGCQRHVFSPPARPVPLEAPRVLAVSETAVSGTASTTQSVFDGAVNGGTLGVRRGIVPGVEIAAEASAFHVASDQATRANLSRTLLTGRLGTKVGLVGHHVSFLGGIGGGHHAAGGFLSPDVGLVAGYDNPYLVPFLLVRAGVSQPVGARTVDLSRPTEAPGTATSRPRTSYFYGATLGLRVPIEPKDARVKGAVMGGVSMAEIRDRDEHRGGLGAALGAEIIF